MVNDLRNTYTKQPFEQLPIDVNFGSLTVLPRGAKEIVASVALAKKWKRTSPDSPEDATSEFLDSSTPQILAPNNCKVRVQVKGGISGYDYQVTVRVTFDNGAKLEEELYIRVQER